MSEKATQKWLISGRVQGVGFRWFVYQRAVGLGLCGWAANRSDGRVEVVAGGPPESLDALEAALAAGPRHASVTHVEKCDFPHEINSLKSFIIK